MIFASWPPRPSADNAHVSSTTSCARSSRDHQGPASAGATLTPIGRTAGSTGSPRRRPLRRSRRRPGSRPRRTGPTLRTSSPTSRSERRGPSPVPRGPRTTRRSRTPRSRTARPSGTVGEREGAAGLVHRSADPTSGLLVGCPVDGCLLLRSRAHTGGGHGDARGAPGTGRYRVHVKPLRYRDRPHLAAWTDFEDRSITPAARAVLPLRRDRPVRRQAADQRQWNATPVHLAHRGHVPHHGGGAAVLVPPRVDALVVEGGARHGIGGRDHVRPLRALELPPSRRHRGRRAGVAPPALTCCPRCGSGRGYICLDQAR